MYQAHSLFDLKKTIAAELIEKATYPWDVLPTIPSFIQHLASKLPNDFEQIAEGIWIGKGTRVAPSALLIAPVIVGYDCDIRHTAFIRNGVIIGNNAVVGNSTEVKNAILFDGVEVPHFNYIGDSILGYKAHLGAGAILSNFKSTKDEISVRTIDGKKIKTGLTKFGALLGDHTEIGCNSVLFPGTVVGRNSIVYPLTPVRGTIPENYIVKKEGELVPKTK